jgi:hypothetical protein
MDIFKLFFNHDQSLRDLKAKDTAQEQDSRLADFMKPSPTYSTFYITGTILPEERFGLSTLQQSSEIIDQLGKVFKNRTIHTAEDTFQNLDMALNHVQTGQALILDTNTKKSKYTFPALVSDDQSAPILGELLQTGVWIISKVQAPHGYDLYLSSRKNIYPDLFAAFKPLIGEQLRFFSINRKRIRTDRQFYFETNSLKKPPHGAEEVFPDTTL